MVIPLEQVYGVLLDIQGLQQAGMHEYGALEKALEHKKYRTWKPTSVVVKPGMAMWVPYGQLVLLSIDSEVASFVVCPWFDSDLARDCTEDVWQYMVGHIISHANKNEQKAPWKKLLPAFRAFSAPLFATT